MLFVYTAGKPWHAKLSVQVAMCVRRSYATQLSKCEKCEEPPSMLICCRATTMADSKVRVHFETL